MVFAPFNCENRYRFCHFGLELGMVFEETSVVCECIYFVVSIPNQSERKSKM